MINCRQCNFLIKNLMRHALVNNCCPACGAAVMGATQTQRMRLFKQRLLEQEFAQSLSEDLVFDITLFMLLEFSPAKPEPVATVGADDEGAAESDSGEANQDQGAEDSYEKIREEIREEVLTRPEGSSEDLDEDLKIARLKRLAKDSSVKRPGAAVRRLGND
jgi:hypothetical protein